jgi:hypothetical protein
MAQRWQKVSRSRRRSHRLPLLVTLGIGLALAAAPSASAGGHHRLPLRPHGHKPFVPRTGDWEGVADGFPASFELKYKPGFAVFGLAPYEFGNLVTLEPSTCPVSSARYAESVIAQNSLSSLKPSGVFPLHSFGFSGKISGRRMAGLKTMIDFPAMEGQQGCQTTLDWVMHPAARQPVDDGIWTLKLSDGETQTFTVSADGRLATGLGFPVPSAQCSSQPQGGADLFIQASGMASLVDAPDGVNVSVNFASAKSATGQFGTGPCAVTLTASLTKSGP